MPNESSSEKLVFGIAGAVIMLAIGALVAKVNTQDGQIASLRVEIAVVQQQISYANATLYRIEGALKEDERRRLLPGSK